MRVTKVHNTTQANAIEIVDNYLRNLLREPLPAGFRIVDPRIDWNDNILNISFNVKQSFLFNKHIVGTVEVNDNSVILNAEISRIPIREATIRDGIMRYLNDMFD